MPVATASGADSKRNGTTRSRDHNQGNQDRKYTVEQKDEVIRIKKCSPTAYYDILGLGKIRTAATDADIKKAYRKISLLTHPDKNGYENADEAFKMVARAFGILGDKEKRARFDQFGGDPDSRFRGQPSSPFSGFAGGRTPRSNSRGDNVWAEEVTPEEMFRKFFAEATGLRGFNAPSDLFFNVRDGPGIRFRQFGGPTGRRREENPNTNNGATSELSIAGIILFVLFIILPIISLINPGSGNTTTGPSMRFDSAVPPHTLQRNTERLKVNYFVNPKDVEGYTPKQWRTLDKKAEINYINRLNVDCQQEELAKQEMLGKARGWLFDDPDRILQAHNLPMVACRKLEALGQWRSH
ncbi:Bgt-1734 [Blumeria graminis f. sp. tritici]|uniref:Bgt-1734 n=2 Tax=Blumeria graminis f. sp. tritici TaxID=62690 RepID=A0A061HIU3_BLUGR|nr:Co-chaperone for Hsp40p [Blumeria graminis f. sp. tritici 96224]VDB93111.1 Bgt-1734 [Blumeria graminis f. sp. tritici]